MWHDSARSLHSGSDQQNACGTIELFLIVLFGLLACVQARTADEFDTIKWGSDIPKAMIGKHSPNNRVTVTGARHSDLGLKDIGGDEIYDPESVAHYREHCDRRKGVFQKVLVSMAAG